MQFTLLQCAVSCCRPHQWHRRLLLPQPAASPETVAKVINWTLSEDIILNILESYLRIPLGEVDSSLPSAVRCDLLMFQPWSLWYRIDFRCWGDIFCLQTLLRNPDLSRRVQYTYMRKKILPQGQHLPSATSLPPKKHFELFKSPWDDMIPHLKTNLTSYLLPTYWFLSSRWLYL